LKKSKWREAAETTLVLTILNSGDHVIAFDDLYAGTRRLFDIFSKNFAIEFTYVDATNPDNVKNAIRRNTKLIWLETPTNPLMKICDIKAITEIARDKGVLVVVDNTFATPYLQKPLLLGADIVVHSTTKFINGHSDSVGGAVMLSDERIYEKLKFNQNAIGAILSPFDSYLVLRGTKTLHLRMERHCQNAMKIAQYLESHPKVKRVYYPGLKSHPQHELAKKQMLDFGGVLSFEIDSDIRGVRRFLGSLRIFTLAESLGGVESLIEHPATMTHAYLSKDEREKIGIKDTLIRISVGLEDIDDLIEDLDRAFDSI